MLVISKNEQRFRVCYWNLYNANEEGDFWRNRINQSGFGKVIRYLTNSRRFYLLRRLYLYFWYSISLRFKSTQIWNLKRNKTQNNLITLLCVSVIKYLSNKILFVTLNMTTFTVEALKIKFYCLNSYNLLNIDRFSYIKTIQQMLMHRYRNIFFKILLSFFFKYKNNDKISM